MQWYSETVFLYCSYNCIFFFLTIIVIFLLAKKKKLKKNQYPKSKLNIHIK